MFLLSNGLYYMCTPMTNTHSIVMSLYINTYEDQTRYNKNGIAHLLEHLHFRRIENYSQKDIYYFFESIGTTLRAVTYNDFIRFYVRIPPDKLFLCLNMFIKLIETYNWTEDEFLLEKKVVINQILEKTDLINIDSEANFAVFGDSRYGKDIIGTVEDIEDLTIDNIINYKKSIFSEYNLLFSLTGNITATDSVCVAKKLQQLSFQKHNNNKKYNLPKSFMKRDKNIHIVNSEDDVFFDVDLSFDITYDYTSIRYVQLLNSILGEGIGSRLQMNIRENNAFTSDVGSFVDFYKKFAILHIRFSVVTDRFYECLFAIVQELKQLKYAVGDSDLNTSMPFFKTQLLFLEDDTLEKDFFLAYRTFVLELDKIMDVCEDFEQIKSKLQTFAQEIFVNQNLSVTIIGDEKQIDLLTLEKILKDLC